VRRSRICPPKKPRRPMRPRSARKVLSKSKQPRRTTRRSTSRLRPRARPTRSPRRVPRSLPARRTSSVCHRSSWPAERLRTTKSVKVASRSTS
jgi:hypothetical protein